MLTGIVSADIAGEITGTFRPRALSFGRVQALADGFFVIADPHTSN